MFEIKVMGIAKAKQQIGADWPTHIISVINDSGTDAQGNHFPGTAIDRQHGNHIIVNFHDVEDEDAAEAYDLVPPSRKVVDEVLEEVASWQLGDDDKLIIHCSAGKSRSTAIALGVLVQAGMSPSEALQKVKLLSPSMLPNRLMVEYVDVYLGLEGKLIEEVQAYYDKSILRIPGINLPNRGGYNR
jgi:predicted protein tyrosine phosphatase